MNEYIMAIMTALAVALGGYIAIAIKKLLGKIQGDTAKSVVKTCVLAVEQIYTQLHGADKKAKCIEMVAKLLNEKGIKVTEAELNALIESAVKEMNDVLKAS